MAAQLCPQAGRDQLSSFKYQFSLIFTLQSSQHRYPGIFMSFNVQAKIL